VAFFAGVKASFFCIHDDNDDDDNKQNYLHSKDSVLGQK
jgi:hypothetical protein